MVKKDNPVSFRLTELADALLTKFAQKLGISRTAVLEIALREFAEKRNHTG